MKNNMLLVLNAIFSFEVAILVFESIQVIIHSIEGLKSPSIDKIDIAINKAVANTFGIVIIVFVTALVIAWRAYHKNKFKSLIIVGVLLMMYGAVLLCSGYVRSVHGIFVSVIGILYLYVPIKEVKASKNIGV